MLRQWIQDGTELAILDPREEAEFGERHLFWAVSCPISRMEIVSRDLLPRNLTRIVCVDDGNGLSERLAAYLCSAGWDNVSILRGGIAAWKAAGNVLFSGINVPSKAFGEWVEHHYETRNVDATQLHAWQAEKKDIRIVDARPYDEFTRMSIPGGLNIPGGELVYRIGDIAPDPNTTIVVNCAGRTRSILGAESLRRAGIPNEVYALRNGTMGWELAGFELNRGSDRTYGHATPDTWKLAFGRAANFADRSGVQTISEAELDLFEKDPARSVYVLDVRDPSEFTAGHYAGSQSAPGGQLVQETDRWVGVRNARIVLIDDKGVRSRMAGAWLRQMGHRDVFVLDNVPIHRAPSGQRYEPKIEIPTAAEISADALVKTLGHGGLVVLDLALSIQFRLSHIPGALWGVRGRLAKLEPQLRKARKVVLTSPDGVLARLACSEVRSLTDGDVVVLQGGTSTWISAGNEVEKHANNPKDKDCVDFYLRPFERNEEIEEAMLSYISWEVDLINEIERDGTVSFGTQSD